MHVLFVVTAVCLATVHCYHDNDLTAEIPPGRAECYYQPVKAGLLLEIEYQVSVSLLCFCIWQSQKNLNKVHKTTRDQSYPEGATSRYTAQQCSL